jgi:hypothetical protein
MGYHVAILHGKSNLFHASLAWSDLSNSGFLYCTIIYPRHFYIFALKTPFRISMRKISYPGTFYFDAWLNTPSQSSGGGLLEQYMQRFTYIFAI